MCGRCKGEPYSGVMALFNGDLHHASDFADRSEWWVLSPNVIVYLGESSLSLAQRSLVPDCHIGYQQKLSASEREKIEELSLDVGRPNHP